MLDSTSAFTRSAPEAAPLAAAPAHAAAPETVVILAAGNGHRMGDKPKPLLELLGLTLLERVILSFASIGVSRFRVVVGAYADRIHSAISSSSRLRRLAIELVPCPSYESGNGHSLAAGAAGLRVPFYLAMADHVFDTRILQRLRSQALEHPEKVHLATDAGIGAVFDLADATKVASDKSGSILGLGKALASYDRVDAGLFSCPAWFADHAQAAVRGGASSVSEVMGAVIERRQLASCPIEPLLWQDIDTPAMLAEARRRLLDSTRKPTDGPVSRSLNRPISLATTGVLASLGVPPNAVTTLVFLIGLAAAWLAAIPTWAALLGAALLTQLASIWDGCDGEIARVTLRASRFGAWYDTITDNLRYAALVAGVSVGLYRGSGDPVYLTLGAAFLASAALLFVVMSHHLWRTRSAGTHLVIVATVEEKRDQLGKNPLLRALISLRVLVKQDVLALLAALALALNLPHLVLGGAIAAVLGILLVVIPTVARERGGAKVSGWSGAITPVFFVLGGVLLLVVVTRFPLEEMTSAAASMGWLVFLTPAIALVWFAACSAGMYELLGASVPWRVLFLNRVMGEGYNSLVPLAGIAGEPLKAHHLSGYTPAAVAIPAVILDRLILTISGLLFSSLCIATALFIYDWPAAVSLAAASYVGLAAAGAALLTLVCLSRAPHRLGHWLRRRLGLPAEPGGQERVPGGAFAKTLGWHLIGRTAFLVEIALLLHLLGHSYRTDALIAVGGVLMAAGVLGFLIPQSLGVAEAASVLAFQLVGLPPVQGVVFGLVRRGRMLAVGFLGVLVHLLRGVVLRARPAPVMALSEARVANARSPTSSSIPGASP